MVQRETQSFLNNQFDVKSKQISNTKVKQIMALKLERGQVTIVNQVQVPIVSFKTCGLTEGKAFRDFFETHFIVIGKYVSDGNGGMMFQVGDVTTEEARNQIFKYAWCTPDTEKQAKKGEIPVTWHSELWSDSLMRKADGDQYDDPGFALGLHLKQEEQKMMPGLHGAPNRTHPIIDSFSSTVRLPVIWKTSLDEDGEVTAQTGELVWLELSFYHYQTLLSSIALYDKQMASVLKKSKPPQSPKEDRMFVVKFTKNPKLPPAERNAMTLISTVDSTTEYKIILPNGEEKVYSLAKWFQPFVDTAVVEYPKMLAYIEKRFTFFKPIVDLVVAGELSEAEAVQLVHAAIAEKLLTGWGEIDSDHGLSAESISQLFETLIPQYSASIAASPIPTAAVKRSVTVDLGEDLPF